VTLRRRVYLHELLGRRVCTTAGEVVGRIEEVRATVRNGEHEVSEYLIGAGALVERLALTRRLFGRRPTTWIARWDQVDIAQPEHPVLTCPVSELRKKHR